LSKYLSFHKSVHQLFKCELCFGEILTDENSDVSSQAEEGFIDDYNKWHVGMFKCELCFGEILTDENSDVSSQAEEGFIDDYNKWHVGM
jgi:hypothetical protein